MMREEDDEKKKEEKSDLPYSRKEQAGTLFLSKESSYLLSLLLALQDALTNEEGQ
jgi:hypothetical protein